MQPWWKIYFFLSVYWTINRKNRTFINECITEVKQDFSLGPLCFNDVIYDPAILYHLLRDYLVVQGVKNYKHFGTSRRKHTFALFIIQYTWGPRVWPDLATWSAYIICMRGTYTFLLHAFYPFTSNINHSGVQGVNYNLISNLSQRVKKN